MLMNLKIERTISQSTGTEFFEFYLNGTQYTRSELSLLLTKAKSTEKHPYGIFIGCAVSDMADSKVVFYRDGTSFEVDFEYEFRKADDYISEIRKRLEMVEEAAKNASHLFLSVSDEFEV